ncbi:MAG: hypothetical protein WKF78_08360 [Candidatus Limnocylindrales bacterium]
MVGSGDRSDKVRTYNYPQDRVTDHRIGKTVHNLPGVLTGELDDLIDALQMADQADRLSAVTGAAGGMSDEHPGHGSRDLHRGATHGDRPGHGPWFRAGPQARQPVPADRRLR